MAWALIYASTETGGIGLDNKLPWNIPADMAHFRNITAKKVVVMGSKTHISIGRPLPNRLNVVISTRKRPEDIHESVVWANTVEEVRSICGDREVVVIGGAMIYALFEDECEIIHHTLIKKDYECDVFFKLKGEWKVKDVIETEEAEYRTLEKIN